MKATKEFFDQLEKEIKNGTFPKTQKETDALPPMPTVKDKPDTPDFTTFRQMLGNYQATLDECHKLIISQKKSIAILTQQLETSESEFEEIFQKQNQAIADLKQLVRQREKDIAYLCDREKIALLDKANAIKAMEKERDALTQRNNQLEKWYDDWQKLRDTIASQYDKSDIEEAGGMDDITVMADTIEAILYKDSREKQLRNEIDRLKKKISSNKDQIENETINRVICEIVDAASNWDQEDRKTINSTIMNTCYAYLSEETLQKVIKLKNVGQGKNSFDGDNNGVVAGGDVYLSDVKLSLPEGGKLPANIKNKRNG